MTTEKLRGMTEAARAAGQRLLARFQTTARPKNRDEMMNAVRANEAAANDGLREALALLEPKARWVDETTESTLLAPGWWWAVDAIEGNVNHIHGLAEWCVSITLLHDNVPRLAVVHQPVGDLTFTAMTGAGAQLNGIALAASMKTDLSGAIVATGQAEAGQGATYARIGESISRMLRHALVVRATVPSTFPLLLVAGGQNDAFWQFSPTLPGIAAGVLFVTEAGGVATRIDGAPWLPGAPDVLMTASGLHSAMVEALKS